MERTVTSGAIALRPGRPDDAQACGRICYEAFRAIAEKHGFPPDFPAPEFAVQVMTPRLSHPGFYSVVAEVDDRIVGSNFLDERSPIAGVGPITVDPAAQDRGVGRLLMLDAMERARERGYPGVRLLQAAYHTRSLALYAALGFAIREPLLTMQGDPVGEAVPGFAVRPAAPADVNACERLCTAVHGHGRSRELADAIELGTAQVVEHDGRITGYTTGIAWFGHSVGETDEDLKALIGAAEVFGGPGFLLPARNTAMVRWCLAHRLRIVHVMTLMTVGLYNEPAGAYLPSILF